MKFQDELKNLRQNEVGAMQEATLGNGGMQNFCYALRKFHKDCENFATIAKISQS